MARVGPKSQAGDGPAFLRRSTGAGGSNDKFGLAACDENDTFKTQSPASSSCSTTRAPSSAAQSNNTSGRIDLNGVCSPAAAECSSAGRLKTTSEDSVLLRQDSGLCLTDKLSANWRFRNT